MTDSFTAHAYNLECIIDFSTLHVQKLFKPRHKKNNSLGHKIEAAAARKAIHSGFLTSWSTPQVLKKKNHTPTKNEGRPYEMKTSIAASNHGLP